MSDQTSTKIDPIGLLFALLGAALFSLKPVMVKLMYEIDLTAETIMAWRMIFSLPFYIVIGYGVYRTRRDQLTFTPRLWFEMIVIGICGYYFATLFDLLGLLYISAQLERIILFTYPTFVAIISYFLYREKLSLKQFMSLILAYGGIAIMFGNELNVVGENVVLGAFYVLLAAITFACYMIFQKGPINQIGSRLFTSIAMSAASIAIFLHVAFFTDGEFMDIGWYGLFLGFITAIFCTVIPSYLLAEAVNRIGSGPTSISIGIGPIFTSIFAVLALSEDFTIYHLIGTVLVIIGIYLLSQVKKKSDA